MVERTEDGCDGLVFVVVSNVNFTFDMGTMMKQTLKYHIYVTQEESMPAVQEEETIVAKCLL